jgi:hypothetical protein
MKITKLRDRKMKVIDQEELSPEFKVQVIHLWDEASFVLTPESWERIEKYFCKEFGVFKLADYEYGMKACASYFLTCSKERALKIIQHTFNILFEYSEEGKKYEKLHPPTNTMNRNYGFISFRRDIDSIIDELNNRFEQSGLEYKFIGGKIIKKDNEFLNAEVIQPSINLLFENDFEGASSEFMKAQDHYKRGRYEEAMGDALKAFESTMKIICGKRGWHFQKSATAKSLIDVIFKNNLLPQELMSHFTALRATLESGLPALTNSHGRHGVGEKPRVIPGYLASYALHICASNIILMVKAFNK